VPKCIFDESHMAFLIICDKTYNTVRKACRI